MKSEEKEEVNHLSKLDKKIECAMRQYVHQLEILRYYVLSEVNSTLTDHLTVLIILVICDSINKSAGPSLT